MTRLSFAFSDENAATQLSESIRSCDTNSSWVEIIAAQQQQQNDLEEEEESECNNNNNNNNVQHNIAHNDDNDQNSYINKNTEQIEEFNVVKEMKQLFYIAAPSVIIQFNLTFIFPMSASAVGRNVGTTELASFSLGSLIGNLTCLSILEGALTASDTLMPRSYGIKQYNEIERLVIRSIFVCCILLMIPVIPLCVYGKHILQFLGQDPIVSTLAEQWIRMYFIGVIPNLIFRVCLRFLLAQHQPWPLVWCSTIPCLLIHPIYLRILIPIAGLQGSALSIALTQWTTAIMILTYLKIYPNIYHKDTWTGLSIQLIKESLLEINPLLKFIHLSLGGIFSMIEWWFFEIMCFIVGSFGVLPLCIHTIAYNLIPLMFMIPLGIMIGLTVRMGHLLIYKSLHAKLLAIYCMIVTTTLGIITSTILYIGRIRIIHVFTNDPDVIYGALHIWTRVCYFLAILHIFGISQAILRGLGMQWRLAIIIAISLYGFTLPTVLYYAVLRHGGLDTLWTIMPLGYTIMQFALIAGYTTINWQHLAYKIRKAMRGITSTSVILKSSVADTTTTTTRVPTEETMLLSSL